MGVVDWVRRVEDQFLDRLEPHKERLALVSGVGFIVLSLGNLSIGAVTGSWSYLLLGVMFLITGGVGIRNWWTLRSSSDSTRL